MAEQVKCESDKADLQARVITISHEDLKWPFTGNPYIALKPRNEKAYIHQEAVDPFPCYSHNRQLTIATAEKVEAMFPIHCQPNYYLLSYEDLGRTNGHASRHYIYTDSKNDLFNYEPYIVFSGKRIPPHPAMTRYLVAHEYGHQVQHFIEAKLGLKESDKSFAKEYAERRGIEADFGYGAQKWHSAIGEIIANDFRIILCGIEREFWPHQGFAHPDTLPQLREFWGACARDYASDSTGSL